MRVSRAYGACQGGHLTPRTSFYTPYPIGPDSPGYLTLKVYIDTKERSCMACTRGAGLAGGSGIP